MPHRILVVEDASEVRQLLVRVLSDAGFDVIEASTTAGAMAMLGTASFDIVITDCFLPDDSSTFVLAVKNKSPQVPVIVLSGDPYAARRLLPDADEVLGKPISLTELVQTLLRFVEGAKQDGSKPGTVH